MDVSDLGNMFVKLKDLGKGTPSQMAEKTPEK